MIETMDQPLAAQRVGWKFARLKTMSEAGIDVPEFFCLTGDFFARAVPAATVREALAGLDFTDWPAVRAAAERIRTKIIDGGLRPEDEQRLAEAIAANFADDAVLAVRASMVGARAEEGEDSAEHAFAGMSDSFLYVPVHGVRDAVLKCWASAFNPEALLYRHRHGLSTQDVSVAVGVQRMVFGERSLVLFTCDPTTHARDTVISAGWGIGEGVVAERTPTDHYFVRFGTGEVRGVIADKTTMVTFDDEHGHGVRQAPVAAERRAAAVLSDAEVTGLAELGRRIEALFGCPQDIEATITPDGAVHVVQSRPITLDPARNRVFSSANVSESFPGTTTPMTYSVARRFYWLLNHDYLRRCGVPERELHRLHETMTRLVARVDGRIYHNITSFIRMLDVFPLFDGLRRDWERLVAELDTSYHYSGGERSRRERLRRAAKLATGWGRAAVNYASLRRDFAAFEREWAGIMESRRERDLTGVHPLTLADDYREVWRRAGDLWGVTLVNYQFMLITHKRIERCLERWGVGDSDTLFSQLLCGGEQLRGAEIALSAVRLSEQVAADPELAALFRLKPPQEIWRLLSAGELPEGFTAAVERHLTRYGDRGLEELKLERPNLREEPWELLRLVGQYATRGITAAEMERTEAETRLAGEERLRRALPSAVKRKVLLGLFDRLRTFLCFREAGRYQRSELFGYSKRIIAALGADLHRRGVLAEAHDVFLLELDELFGFLDGSGSTHDLAGLVEVRRGDAARAELRRPQREFSTADVVALSVPEAVAEEPDAGGALRGLGSCPGKVRGRARIVLDPAFADDLDENDILVARETDPGWLYLMLRARGIVVERGSLLSHTAITGRKFGIPTIVAVPGALQRIPDGALIELDGATGTVTLVED
ncbi:PEP/pyruvate-binding domain-containing protein [Lentzea sp. NPDC092896]|uniref:PEP/pyruvate-binding domain-containing protein n=1 Tax=Lentzea sp. NPDC092896 TaxID=3364127 RepID=UPI0038204373